MFANSLAASFLLVLAAADSSPGGFTQSCTSINIQPLNITSVGDNVVSLVASCPQMDGTVVRNGIPLSYCFGDDHGNIVPSKKYGVLNLGYHHC